MKKRNLLVVALILLASPLWAGQLQDKLKGVIVSKSAAAPAGPTCSGDFSSGANESFEKGAGAFCTTDWTESDAGAVINTYSTGWAVCGTHSLEVTMDTDNTGGYLIIDLGGEDSNFYFRYYMKVGTYSDGNYFIPAGWSRYGSVINDAIRFKGASSNLELYLYNGSTNSTNYFTVASTDEIMIEMHMVGGGSNTVKVFRKNGASWDAVLNDASGAEISNTGASTWRYFRIEADIGNTTTRVWYYDDFKVALSGADYIGADTCE